MSTVIDHVERDDRFRSRWSSGPKPSKLEPHCWLCEVVRVTDGTGIGAVERAWWTEVVQPRYGAFPTTAELVAETAADAWYDETDQSGASAEVVLRCQAWTGESWVVEVPMEWELKISPKQAVKVTDEPAKPDAGGAA